jgi:tetratricopeptide (TPR) repeat protein
MDKKVCFVVMGFGKKTDYELGRTFDLDATFEAIIKPAVEKANLKCVRADEILHSGIIDTEMYKMLYQADLVIADISTGNVNAIYELGVRHALRPSSTIIMKEQDGRFSFDLDHTSTFQYEHLGKDIGSREAIRASNALKELILASLEDQGKIDSPVYTYLPNLKIPMLSEQEFQEKIEELEEESDHLHMLLESGKQALNGSDFSSAVAFYKAAANKTKQEPSVLQKLVLATYKSKLPTQKAALNNALEIAQQLTPYHSNDPETCGLTGAIHKRLWLLNSKTEDLELAIKQYGRGFEIRRDYYNGENYATCLDLLADLGDESNEIIYNRIRAYKVRLNIIESLEKMVADHEKLSERSDRKWILASLSNCYYAIGNDKKAQTYEGEFLAGKLADWEKETFSEGKITAQQAFEKLEALRN